MEVKKSPVKLSQKRSSRNKYFIRHVDFIWEYDESETNGNEEISRRNSPFFPVKFTYLKIAARKIFPCSILVKKKYGNSSQRADLTSGERKRKQGFFLSSDVTIHFRTLN